MKRISIVLITFVGFCTQCSNHWELSIPPEVLAGITETITLYKKYWFRKDMIAFQAGSFFLNVINPERLIGDQEVRENDSNLATTIITALVSRTNQATKNKQLDFSPLNDVKLLGAVIYMAQARSLTLPHNTHQIIIQFLQTMDLVHQTEQQKNKEHITLLGAEKNRIKNRYLQCCEVGNTIYLKYHEHENAPPDDAIAPLIAINREFLECEKALCWLVNTSRAINTNLDNLKLDSSYCTTIRTLLNQIPANAPPRRQILQYTQTIHPIKRGPT